MRLDITQGVTSAVVIAADTNEGARRPAPAVRYSCLQTLAGETWQRLALVRIPIAIGLGLLLQQCDDDRDTDDDAEQHHCGVEPALHEDEQDDCNDGELDILEHVIPLSRKVPVAITTL